MKLSIIVDEDNEMLSITSKNGEYNFFGNWWDFNVPDDLFDLLKSTDVDFTWDEEEIDT